MDSAISKYDVMEVFNPFQQAFRFRWDGQDYEIPGESSEVFPEFLGMHAAKKIIIKYIEVSDPKGRIADILNPKVVDKLMSVVAPKILVKRRKIQENTEAEKTKRVVQQIQEQVTKPSQEGGRNTGDILGGILASLKQNQGKDQYSLNESHQVNQEAQVTEAPARQSEKPTIGKKAQDTLQGNQEVKVSEGEKPAQSEKEEGQQDNFAGLNSDIDAEEEALRREALKDSKPELAARIGELESTKRPELMKLASERGVKGITSKTNDELMGEILESEVT